MIFNRIILLIIFQSLVAGKLWCQQTGSVEIIEDKKISLLVEKHIEMNQLQFGAMDGYRIQVFFDSGNDSKKKAMDTRNDFQAKFPSVAAYLSFQEPFYKIRAGDFRFKVEADGFLQKIIAHYPNAYTVRDRINYPRLED
jgi:hypothetical protein